MKLYKMRSPQNRCYTIDILENERLFCANHRDLNDPFEGFFFQYFSTSGGIARGVARGIARGVARGVTGGGTSGKSIKRIEDLPHFNDSAKVCSLSRTMEDVRLWSYYADGHKGVAVEFEIDDRTENLHEVFYSEGLMEVKKKITVNSKASDILSFKTNHWIHEQEYRIIHDNPFYELKGCITGLYFGVNASTDLKSELIKSLPSSAKAYETKIEPNSVTIKRHTQVRD